MCINLLIINDPRYFVFRELFRSLVLLLKPERAPRPLSLKGSFNLEFFESSFGKSSSFLKIRSRFSLSLSTGALALSLRPAELI